MPMSSQQITNMAMGQQAYFGNVQNYARSISPYGWMGGGVPYTAGAQQGFAEQALGTSLSGVAGLAGGISSVAGGVAGLAGGAQMAAGGIGAIGGLMSGAGMMAGASAGSAALSSVPVLGTAVGIGAGLPFAAGAGLVAGGAAMAGQVYGGFEQRQGVNQSLRQNFGGMMGVGGGRGGTGFNSKEMGGISTMMREMSGNDQFMQFDELTRVMDRTADMGLYRGVQSAREFKEKFRKTVDTLKEIATTMQTSLEGATQFMDQQRSQGFFSGEDINRSLLRTKFQAGATGMSTQQLSQIGQMGSQQGRAMGMLGRSGAQAAQMMAGNVAMAMRSGAVDDEMIAEATGGLTGAEGAQAFSGRMMGVTNRFLSRGAGRALMAGLWDPESGGVDMDRLRSAASGGLSFRDALSKGRANIRGSGGRRSEFFSQEERIRGKLMASGIGPEAVMGMLGQHMEKQRGLTLDDPIMQRWVRRRLKVSQSEVELMAKMTQELPSILQEQRARFGQQMEQEGVSRAREGSGVEGFRRKLQQVWERDVLNPFRQVGDDLTTVFSEAVQGAVDDLEGVVSTRMTTVGKKMTMELARTGKSSLQFKNADASKRFRAWEGQGGAGGDSLAASAGRFFGMRGEGAVAELAAMGQIFSGSHEDAIQLRDKMRASTDATLNGVKMTANESSRMTERLSNLILDNPDEYGSFQPGFFEQMAGGGGPISAVVGGGRREMRQFELFSRRQQRASNLIAADDELRSRTRDMNDVEKLAFIDKQISSGRLKGTKYDLGQHVAGGSGSARFGRGLQSLAKFRSQRLESLQELMTEEDDGALGVVSGGLAAALGAGAGSLLGVPGAIIGGSLAYGANRETLEATVGGDVEGLLNASGENAKLRTALMGLAGQGDRKGALRELRLAEAGEASYAGLSPQQRRAAGQLARQSGKAAEKVSKVLQDVLQSDSERTRRLAMQPMIKRAEKLQQYIGGRKDYEELKWSTRSTVERYLETQSDDTKSEWEVAEDRRLLLAKLAGTKEGQKVASILGQSVEGRYLAGDIERAGAEYSRLSGRGGLRNVMKEALGSAGEGLLQGSDGRRLLNKLKRGKVTTDQLMDQLREEAGGTLTSEHLGGLTEEQFRSRLSTTVGRAKGGIDKVEAKVIAAERASEEGRRLQLETQRNEERDLPSLAKKQIQHLGTMEKLLYGIAKKNNVINVTVDAEGNVDASGVTTPPSGKKKK